MLKRISAIMLTVMLVFASVVQVFGVPIIDARPSTSITRDQYNDFGGIRHTSNNSTRPLGEGITFVADNNNLNSWYIYVTDDLSGNIDVAYQISNRHYVRTVVIQGAGRYIIGDSRGQNGLNEIRLGDFISDSAPMPVPPQEDRDSTTDVDVIPDRPSQEIGQGGVVFTDSRGNVHNIMGGGTNVTIRESNRASSDYIDTALERPMLDNLITITRGDVENSISVLIELRDDDVVPYLLYRIFPNGDMELRPFFFNEEDRTISFVVTDNHAEVTFMPVTANISLTTRRNMARNINDRRMFNIIHNSGGTVEISLDFLRTRPTGPTYSWAINRMFYTVRDSSGAVVSGGRTSFIEDSDFRISLSGLAQGVYSVRIEYEQRGFVLVWEQDIYTEGVATANRWSRDEISQIAARFAPIVVLNPDEEFYPVGLDFMFGNNMPTFMHDVPMRVDNIHGGLTMPYRDLINVLPSNGHRNGLIRDTRDTTFHRFTGSPREATIYYSYVESGTEVFINFHMFYTFDPKDNDAQDIGTWERRLTGAHIFDRESFVIVFDKRTKEPLRAIFAGHLVSHPIRLEGPSRESLQSWTGRTYIDFRDVNTLGDRPIIHIARGGHAPFPIGTRYGVNSTGAFFSPNRAGVLDRLTSAELASSPMSSPIGGKMLIPNRHTPTNHGFNTYSLRRLDLNRASDSNIPQNILSFSGYFVEMGEAIPIPSSWLGHAKFPPFTERERDTTNWATGITPFNWNTIDISHIESLTTVNMYLGRHLTLPQVSMNVGGTMTFARPITITFQYGESAVDIPFQAFVIEQEGVGGFTYVEASRFYNMLGSITHMVNDNALTVNRLLSNRQNVRFDLMASSGRNTIVGAGFVINPNVYRAENGALFSHIRYLVSEFNASAPANSVVLDTSGENIRIIFEG